eukprot:SAG11_NODE_2023_length_3910_cov_3.261349_4_plen_81_part_00
MFRRPITTWQLLRCVPAKRAVASPAHRLGALRTHQRALSAAESDGARGGLFGKGGRFVGAVDPLMEQFNASISFDKRCGP